MVNRKCRCKKLGIKMPYEGFKPDYTGTILPKKDYKKIQRIRR
jgi:hypothetical protein